MPNNFEIYFHNLNEKAQKEYLEFRGLDDPEQYTETAPIATVERPDPFYWGP